MTATFPQVPLDLRCDINAGGWQNVSTTGKPYQREGTSPPVVITRGRPNETSTATASSCTFQANNRGGNWSPKNPLGAWYGSLGRNTPVRWSVPAIGNYLRMEDAASAAICPDTASLDITGDTDIRIDMTVSGIGPYGSMLAAKADNGIYTGSQTSGVSWMLALNPDLTPLLGWSPDGVTPVTVSGSLPVPARGRFALRATLAVATGTVTFYTAPSMSGSWTQLGPAASGTGGASTSVYNGALGAPLTVGWCTGGQASGSGIGITNAATGINGRVWEFRLLSGIGGTVKADPVFSAQAAGVTSFPDGQSNAWGLYGTAEISSRDYRYHGELSQLPPRWDATGTDQWVEVTAGGLLRRLGQGSAPLLSPMARYYTVAGAPATAAFWPMEDGAGSTQLGALVGQVPMYFGGSPKLSSSSAFAGSGSLPVSNGATFSATVSYAGNWTDNAVNWLMMIPAGEPDGTIVAVIYTTGEVGQITVTYNTASSGSLTMRGYDQTGTLSWTTPALTGINGKALAVQASLQTIGVAASLAVIAPGAPAATTVGNIFGFPLGAVTRVVLNPGGGLANTVLGHLAVLPVFTGLAFLNGYTTPSGASTGPLTAWQYEPAGVRAGRLALEQGMQFRGTGNLLGTQAMGPQTATDLVSLLTECETADRGMITEPRPCLGIGYRARSSMYGQGPLPLDYSLAQLGGTGTMPEPTFDDQFVRNDETVSRSGGSGSSGASARFVLSDGSAMSTQVIGDYANSDSLNLAFDGQLLNEAAWIVHVGTVDEARWPSVPLNLARTELAALWYSLLDEDLGDRFQAANLPDVVMYDPADQIVSQVKESLGGFFYQMDWAGVPAKPYTVAVAGTARAATAATALGIAASSSATLLDLVTTAGNPWTTAAGDFPLDLAVGGERVTASAISAGGALSVALADGTFDVSGITDWTAAGGTGVSLSLGGSPHTGAHAASVKTTSGGSQVTLRPLQAYWAPAVAGATYTAAAWVEDFNADSAQFCCSIDWYTAAGAYISTSSGPASNPGVSTYAQFTVAGTAPAGAAWAAYGPTRTGTLATADNWEADDITITVPAQAATVTRSVNGVVKAQPALTPVQVWIPAVAAL